MIDGAEIHMAGMPGNGWTDTPWEPIYTDACDYDVVAQRCLGRDVIRIEIGPMDTREERW